ncbi:hypothetical protein [Streptomyces sp. NPDC051183]|uniref:hypothetical protein n=1 Tax=Streptomyces sp. NPDC051183 TaxID=3155165 RepID=UPI0034343E63
MRNHATAATALGATVLLALTACSPSGKTAATDRPSTAPSSAAPSPSPSKPAGVLDGLSGEEIMNKGYEATRGADSMHVVATMPVDGKTVHLDMSMDKKGNCNGTIRQEGMGTVAVIRSADLLHLKADADFWRNSVAGTKTPKKQVDAMVTLLADRWVKTSSSDEETKDMAHMCDMKELTADFDKASPLARKGETTTVDGKQVVAVTGPVKAGMETDWVATEGTPYILKATVAGEEQGELHLSAYNVPVDTASPTGDVLDLAKLKKGEAV